MKVWFSRAEEFLAEALADLAADAVDNDTMRITWRYTYTPTSGYTTLKLVAGYTVCGTLFELSEFRRELVGTPSEHSGLSEDETQRMLWLKSSAVKAGFTVKGGLFVTGNS